MGQAALLVYRKMVSLPRRRSTVGATVWAVAWIGLMAMAGPLRADPEGLVRVSLSNGINATVYTPEYLMERTVIDDDRGRIEMDDGRYLEVITDVEDPLIINKGDGQFHAFEPDLVIRQLGEIEYPNMRLGVEVFLLPFPRTQLLVSSTSGHRVYLSPHMYPVGDESTAYIVAHEMGHVFQDTYLPVDAIYQWDEYRRLRDIANAEIYNASAEHANRPLEIFAEDFRVLYGGPEAYFEGRVENPYLPSPETVPGLYGFFAKLSVEQVARGPITEVRAYPNPFNPRTELLVQVDPSFFQSGSPLTIRVYDVRGALVRELYDGRPRDTEVRVGWDGKNQRGRQVASSTYFAAIEAGQTRIVKKLLMIK